MQEYRRALLKYSPNIYWPMDDSTGTTAVDRSTNAFHGTIIGSPGRTRGLLADAGDGPTGLVFDGVDDSVVGPSVDFRFQSLTLMAWVMLAHPTANQNVVGPDDTALDKYHMIRAIAGNFQYALRFAGDQIITGSAYQAGKPYMVVGTYDGANMRFFRNGGLDGTLAITGTPNPNGVSPFTVSNALKVAAGGRVAHAAAWSGRVLTIDEIRHLYRIGARTLFVPRDRRRLGAPHAWAAA